MVSRLLSLAIDRLEKNNKVAEYQLRHSTPVVVVTVSVLPFPVTSDFAMYIRKPRISGAVLVEARSMTYGDLCVRALPNALVAVSRLASL